MKAHRPAPNTSAAKGKVRVRFAAPLALTIVCGQGCFVFPYNTTPRASGTIVDASTGQPVAGAKIGFRDHRKSTHTKVDGSFDLHAGYTWGPAFILPFELTPCGGIFFVEAQGYLTFEQDVGL